MKYKHIELSKDESLLNYLNKGYELLVEVDGKVIVRKKKINLWLDITLFLIVVAGVIAVYYNLPTWIKK